MRYFSTPSDRTKWGVGTHVEVFAFAENRNLWYRGVIEEISHDREGEKLHVKYGNNYEKRKQVKRYDKKNIRPVRRSPEQLLTEDTVTEEAVFCVIKDPMKNMSPSDIDKLTSSEVDELLSDGILDEPDRQIIFDFLEAT